MASLCRFRASFGPCVRRLSASVAATQPHEGARNLARRLKRLGAVGVACVGAQACFGSAEKFYDYRFVTRKDPEDLADFYGSEDFMKTFCVFPFVLKLVMRGSSFNDQGVCHAYGFPGMMSVKKDCEGTDGLAQDTTVWFNKQETFHDLAPFGSTTWWDMAQDFGFHWLGDGTCEVYHHGVYFHGPFPIRVLFQLHARYVAWAAEKHINSDKFGADDREKLEEKEQTQRKSIPSHIFKEFLQELETDLAKTLETKQTSHIPKTTSTLKRISRRSGIQEHEQILSRIRHLIDECEEDASVASVHVSRKGKKSVPKYELMVPTREAQRTISRALTYIAGSESKSKSVHDALQRLHHKTLNQPANPADHT